MFIARDYTLKLSTNLNSENSTDKEIDGRDFGSEEMSRKE
jgi:hypothetical protein